MTRKLPGGRFVSPAANRDNPGALEYGADEVSDGIDANEAAITATTTVVNDQTPLLEALFEQDLTPWSLLSLFGAGITLVSATAVAGLARFTFGISPALGFNGFLPCHVTYGNEPNVIQNPIAEAINGAGSDGDQIQVSVGLTTNAGANYTPGEDDIVTMTVKRLSAP